MTARRCQARTRAHPLTKLCTVSAANGASLTFKASDLLTPFVRMDSWRGICTCPPGGCVRISGPHIGKGRESRRPSDNGAWFVDSASFRHLTEMEIHKAQRLRYCLSLVCITTDLRSSEAEQPAPPPLAELITPHIRSTDVVAYWASLSLAMLLVDAEFTSLPSIVRRLTTRLEMFVWSAGGACYPRTATRAGDLFHQALDLMTQAREDGGKRLYLPT